eukprot:2966264-Pyramimonas_sp.AAC.1
MARGRGRCIGGAPISDQTREFALEHLRTYATLAKDVLRAEFPDFGLLCSFAVFALPRKQIRNTDA